MNQHVYHLSCLIGTVLCGGGAGVQWGAGAGFMVGGALVLALTVYGVELSRRARRSAD